LIDRAFYINEVTLRTILIKLTNKFEISFFKPMVIDIFSMENGAFLKHFVKMIFECFGEKICGLNGWFRRSSMRGR